MRQTDWEEQAVLEVKRRYALEYRLAGEAKVRQRVREGLAVAQRQGIPDGPRALLMAIGCAIVPEGDRQFHSGLWARAVLRTIPGETAPEPPPPPSPPPGPRAFSRTLTIRTEQMRALRETVAEGFRGRMLGHLGRVFPERVQEMGRAAVLAAIDAGVAKAAECEVHGERSVAMLVDLVFVHGADFDRKEPLAWTAELLRAVSIPGVGLPDVGRTGAVFDRTGRTEKSACRESMTGWPRF